MKYKVIITKYATGDKPEMCATTRNLDWDRAIQRARGSSDLAELTWTRHPNVSGAISHMDQYTDLFNEGTIKIEKDE